MGDENGGVGKIKGQERWVVAHLAKVVGVDKVSRWQK